MIESFKWINGKNYEIITLFFRFQSKTYVIFLNDEKEWRIIVIIVDLVENVN